MLAHAGHHLRHRAAALLGDAGGLQRQLVGLLGGVGVLAHGGGEFFHR